MENTTAIDSNSESDISDSWALIDEDCTLEWNNEVGLGPRKFILEENEVVRTSSRNEVSDEDSIEVVADDHTDCLSDNELEGVKDGQQSVGESEELRVIPEIDDNKALPVQPSSDQNVPHNSTTLTECKLSPAVVALFLMTVVGGISIGYSLALWQVSEDAASLQNARALIEKLENENLFLQNQLHHVHSLLMEFPKLAEASELVVHMKPLKQSDVDYAGLCRIMDFLQLSHLSSNNISYDVCLLNRDKPCKGSFQSSSNKKAENSASDAELSAQVTSKSDVEDIFGPVHSDRVSVSVEKTPKLSGHLISEESLLQETESSQDTSEVNTEPVTKARKIVEKMLTILENNIQNSFPSKFELVGILPQNELDFSPDNYKHVVAFKNQMQVNAQKILTSIESSSNNFMRKIADKFKKFETQNRKQICKLKSRLESTPDGNRIDWSKPIFSTCDDYKDNDSALKKKDHRKPNHIKETGHKQTHTNIRDANKNIQKSNENEDLKLSSDVTQKFSEKPSTLEKKSEMDNSKTYGEEQGKRHKLNRKEDKQKQKEEKQYKKERVNIKNETFNKKNNFDENERKVNKNDNDYNNKWQEKSKKEDFDGKERKWREGTQHKQDKENLNYKQATYNKKKINEEKERKGNEKDNDFNTKRQEKSDKEDFDGKERNWREGAQHKEDKENLNYKHATYNKKKINEEKERKGNEKDDDFNIKWQEKSDKRDFDGKERNLDSNKDRKRKQMYVKDDKISGEQKMAHDQAKYHHGFQHNTKDTDHVSHGRAEDHSKYDDNVSGEWMQKMAHGRAEQRHRDHHSKYDDNVSGEWMQKMAHGRAEQRHREHQSDWVFDRAEYRKSSRGKERRNPFWYESSDTFNSNVCNKTKTFKDQASKAWKDVKHHVKESVLRPIVDTAKTAKRVFNQFNNYRSHRE